MNSKKQLTAAPQFFVFVFSLNCFRSPQTLNNPWRFLEVEAYKMLTDNINYIGIYLQYLKYFKINGQNANFLLYRRR